MRGAVVLCRLTASVLALVAPSVPRALAKYGVLSDELRCCWPPPASVQQGSLN